jgi:hypothetical protein
MTDDDPYADVRQHRLTPETLAKLAVVPRKMQRRRQHFVSVPWTWIERLSGATGKTCLVALHLLYLHWKGGVSRSSSPTACCGLTASAANPSGGP